MTRSNQLFAYGSLLCQHRRGLHPLLHGRSNTSRPASLPGKLFQITTDYPGAIRHFGQRWRRVHGRCYPLHCPQKTLAQLDHYEECTPAFPSPHEYQRCCVPIKSAGSRTFHAWIYLYQHPTATLKGIPSGRWCCRRRLWR